MRARVPQAAQAGRSMVVARTACLENRTQSEEKEAQMMIMWIAVLSFA
jgi:hypothetical protein